MISARKLAVLLSVLASVGAADALGEECTFDPWQDYQGVTLFRHGDIDAYFFVTDEMAIDADGAPNAYGPDDIGLDYNENAGYPGTDWWPNVLVPDPDNPSQPYIQTEGEFAGFYVSMTALSDTSLPRIDPRAYVDATRYPYLVFPGRFVQMAGTGRMGDFGYALHLDSGLASAFVVADVGPSNAELGEVSIALAEALGGVDVNPRTGRGQPEGDVAYVVFRFSSSDTGSRWRLPDGEIERRSRELIDSIGGVEAITACVG